MAKAQRTERYIPHSGPVFQAVRDIMRGYQDFQIVEFLLKRWKALSREQALELIALAHEGIVAAGKLQRLPRGQSVPDAEIPRLPS